MQILLNAMGSVAILLASVVALSPGQASAAEVGHKETQTIHATCTTGGTAITGERQFATSDWTTVTVPPDYVILKTSVETTITSKNGSDNRVDIEFLDDTELISDTGLKGPRTIRVRAYAVSPHPGLLGGYVGARGWTHANVVFQMVKFK